MIFGDGGADTIRLTGRGPNRVFAGAGNDVVHAYADGRLAVDCGPGSDRVEIGYNRGVTTRGCECVTRRYARNR